MKRLADEELGNSPTRRRTDSGSLPSPSPEIDQFDASFKKHASELIPGATYNDEFIQGQVIMIWRPMKRFQLEVRDVTAYEVGPRVYHFDVEFRGHCGEYFDNLSLDIYDNVNIALKGAAIKPKSTTRPTWLPFTVQFTDGVILQYIQRCKLDKQYQNGQIINLFDVTNAHQERKRGSSALLAPVGDDWYSTPHDPSPHPDLKPPVEAEASVPRTILNTRPDGLAESSRDHNATARVPPRTPSNESNTPLDASTPRPQDRTLPSAPAHASTSSANPPLASSQEHQHSNEPRQSKSISLPRRNADGKSVAPPQINAGDAKASCPPRSPPPQHGKRKRQQQPDAPPPPPPNGKVLGRLNRKKERKDQRRQKPERSSEETQIPEPPQEEANQEADSGQDRASNVKAAEPGRQKPERTSEEPQTSRSPQEGNQGAGSGQDRASSVKAEESAQSESPAGTPQVPEDPALRFPAGFTSPEGGYYAPISSLEKHRECNLIGVVTSCAELKQTRTGDWCRSVTLADSSNIEMDANGQFNGNGMMINCFMKKWKEWLPQPQRGDILLLRRIRKAQFNGRPAGIGYNGQFHWAIYKPGSSTMSYGELGDAPREETLDDGFGPTFTPFWTSNSDRELQYCKLLSEWWQCMLRVQAERMGPVIQVGEGQTERKSRREHKLICDVTPDTKPNGYFDCTVEIMHGFQNDNGVYSLYVTDYTRRENPMPFDSPWCRPEFADRVLKIETWDSAAEIGRNTKAGEVYYLGNVQMKFGKSGYHEGKMSLYPKAHKIDIDEDNGHLEQRPQVKALLQCVRKEEYENIALANSTFHHHLIQDLKDDMFTHCTVEILHVDQESDTRSDIYVTDYSPNPSLAAPKISWAQAPHLPDRVLKIQMWDSHAEASKHMHPSDLCMIRNLRVKSASEGLQGRLGGHDKLVYKLRKEGSVNENVTDLLRRKGEWEERLARQGVDEPPVDSGSERAASPMREEEERLARQDVIESSADNENERGEPPTLEEWEQQEERLATQGMIEAHALEVASRGCSTIQEIEAHEDCPVEFDVLARVVDFWPLHLSQCLFLRCMRCEKTLPRSMRRCIQCDNDDVDDTVRCFMRIFFRLEDQSGAQLEVSANAKEWPLWEDLEFSDPGDRHILKTIKSRLRPFMGNLSEVHEALEENVEVEVDSPWLRCTIFSWPLEIEGKGLVRKYDILDANIVRASKESAFVQLVRGCLAFAVAFCHVCCAPDGRIK